MSIQTSTMSKASVKKVVSAAAENNVVSTFEESFENFQKVCDRIRSERSHTKKTTVLKNYIEILRKNGR